MNLTWQSNHFMSVCMCIILNLPFLILSFCIIIVQKNIKFLRHFIITPYISDLHRHIIKTSSSVMTCEWGHMCPYQIGHYICVFILNRNVIFIMIEVKEVKNHFFGNNVSIRQRWLWFLCFHYYLNFHFYSFMIIFAMQNSHE